MVRILDRVRRMFCRGGRAAAAPGSERRDAVAASEVNYFGLAAMLIDQHGKEAGAEAARLTQDAIEEADMDAVADWRAVEQAVALLTKKVGGAVH